MIESFVDLTYRSLPLGRRVKLTQVRPSTGYLEAPAPMPVGSRISVSADEGVTFDAVVAFVHEQVGGSDHQPGMLIQPVLADDKVQSWWQARVALPELAPRSSGSAAAVAPTSPVLPRARRTAEMPSVPQSTPASADHTEPTMSRTATIVDKPGEGPARSAAEGELAAAAQTVVGSSSPPVIDDGVRTTVMQAIDDPALIDQMSAEPATTDAPIIDDGKKTIVMAAVDVRALGLEPSSSGEIPVVSIDTGDDDSDDDKSDANGSSKKGGPGRRRRGKRR